MTSSVVSPLVPGATWPVWSDSWWCWKQPPPLTWRCLLCRTACGRSNQLTHRRDNSLLSHWTGPRTRWSKIKSGWVSLPWIAAFTKTWIFHHVKSLWNTRNRGQVLINTVVTLQGNLCRKFWEAQGYLNTWTLGAESLNTLLTLRPSLSIYYQRDKYYSVLCLYSEFKSCCWLGKKMTLIMKWIPAP